MKIISRFGAAVFALLAILVFCWLWLAPRRPMSPPETVHTSSGLEPAKSAPEVLPAPAKTSEPTIVAPLAVTPQTPDALEAFALWSRRYLAASDDQKTALEAEGLSLARARRPVFKQLIQADPRQALERAVPMVTRQQLPASVLAQLERRVHARAEVEVLAVSDGSGPEEPVVRRFTRFDGEELRTFVYGRRSEQNSLVDVPVHGVAVDSMLALHESPLRVLEVGEKPPTGMQTVETCPVSGITTPVESPEEPITEDTPVVQVGETLVYLCDGGHIRLYEEELIAGEGGTGGATALTGPAATSFSNGPRRLLYMRVIFPDDLQQPQTETEAWEAIRQLNSYFTEVSYGKIFYLCDVTPTLLMPRTRAWYTADYADTGSNNPIMNDAKDTARGLGYSPDNYEHYTVIYTNGGGPGTFGGLGSVGGRNVWLRSNSVGVFAHEIGHNVGLWHGNSWDSNRPASASWNTTNATDPIAGGRNGEYGHVFDVLGSSGSFSSNKGHFMGHHKNLMNWLPNEGVTTATVDGVYRVFAMDQNVLDPTRRYGLRVNKDAGRDYWLDFRQKYNSDHRWFRDGVLLHWTRWGQNLDVASFGSNRGGQLLDTTPGSADGKNDSPIVIGRTFSDRESGIHLTPLGKGGTVPESMDVQVRLGFFPGNNAPQIQSLSASSTTPAVNSSVTFTVDATDADGDALAYFWDFGDATYGDNAATTVKQFTSARHHAVRCIVSDMKGGETSKLLLITVGTPTTHTATGRVLDDLGNPLPEVRVQNGGTAAGFRGAWTDSNGDFVVTHLASGSVTLTPVKAGYTFSPANRALTLGPAATGVNFTASESVRLSVEAVDGTAAETGGNPGLFRLTRTGDTTAALTVLVDWQGEAALNSDFTLSPAPDTTTHAPIEAFTIPVGEASLDITLTASNDSTREGPEAARIVLIPDLNYTITGRAAAEVMINDTGSNGVVNRVTVVALDADAEESGDPGRWEIRRIGPTTASLQVSFTLDGATGTTAATNGTDYTLISSPVTIPAGQSSVQIDLQPLQDTLVEGQETARLTISTSTAYGVITANNANNASLRLADDDSPVVTLTATDATASEAGNDTGRFTVSRSGDTTTALEVAYTVSGNALHGTDYLALPGFLTIPAGQSSADIVIVPVDDAQGEPAQTVVLQLRNDPRYVIGSALPATVTINDNDLPVVAIGVLSGLAQEPTTAGTFRISTTGTGTGNITINYSVSGTATSGVDFQTLTGSLSMGRNTNATLTLTPIDDLLPEDAESVTITLLPSPSYLVDVLQPTATLVIRDNDHSQSVSASFSTLTMTENGTSKLFLSRVNPNKSNATTGNLTVNYTLSGTATDGDDYSGLSGSAVIPSGASNVSVDVLGVPDSLTEGTETLVVTLAPGAYSREVATASLRLLDSATSGFARTASFSTRSSTKTEGDPAFTIPVILSAPDPVNPVTIDYLIDTNSATGSGVDVHLTAGSLVFPPGATQMEIPVSVIDDLLPEPEEHLTLKLSTANGAQLTNAGSYHTLFIRDNEPRITLSAQRPTAYEQSAAPGRFLLTRRGSLSAALTVALTYSGTATAGSDFTALPATVTFPAGQRTASVTVTPLTDAVTEGSETVIATLTTSSRYFIDGPAASTVTLLDSGSNHAPSVLLTRPASSETGLPLGTGLLLAAEAWDDQTSPALSVQWTRPTGPGTATFQQPTALTTGVVLSAAGRHVLRCTVTDGGGLTAFTEVAVVVAPGLERWSLQNIGITGTNAIGSADRHGRWLQNQGAGSSLTSTSDSFHFTSSEMNGDGHLIARYEGTDGFFSSARTGLMLRDGTAANARQVTLTFAGTSGSLDFGRRTTAGGSVTNTTVSLPPGPRWLRLSRAGNAFTAWQSVDAQSWTQVGTSQTLTLPSLLRAGIATTSGNSARPARGVFSQVSVSGQPENSAPLVQAAAQASLTSAAFGALSGQIIDDDQPSSASPPTAQWSQVSGPGSVVFDVGTETSTSVAFPAEGSYVLRLAADDGASSSYSEVSVAVTFAQTTQAAGMDAEEESAVAGHFIVTRDGPLDQPLTVQCATSGTATPGVDYAALPSQLTFPAGVASLQVPITPLPDALAEGDETVLFSIQSGTGYHPPATAPATIALKDKPLDALRFNTFGAQANDPAVSGLLEDPDNDGLANLLELALGSGALDPAPSPIVIDTTQVGADTFLRLTLPKNPAVDGLVNYTVEASSNLSEESWSSDGLVIEANSATLLRVRDSQPMSNGQPRFMRARVSLPPAP